MQDNRTNAIRTIEDPCLSMAGTNNTTHRVSATYASLPAPWEFPIANPSLIIHVADATLCLNCGSSRINDTFRWRSRNRAMRQNLSETQCKCNLKTRRLQYIEPGNWAACVALFATISLLILIVNFVLAAPAGSLTLDFIHFRRIPLPIFPQECSILSSRQYSSHYKQSWP